MLAASSRARFQLVGSLALLALLAAYVLFIPPGRASTIHLATLPGEIAGFSGRDLPLEQAVLDDLDPDGILIRRYERAGVSPVWLVVVYFENARLGAHNPELCYRSQGFDVKLEADRALESAIGTVPCKVFEATRGDRQELVNYFWYTAGRRAIGEVKTFRDQMFFQGLKSNRSFGAFVRISTLTNGDRAGADALLARFVEQLAQDLPAMIPEEN